MRFGVIYFTRIKKSDSLGFCFVFFFKLGKLSSFNWIFCKKEYYHRTSQNLYEPKNLWISLEISTIPSGSSFICIKMVSNSKNGTKEQHWKVDLKYRVFKKGRSWPLTEDWGLHIAPHPHPLPQITVALSTNSNGSNSNKEMRPSEILNLWEIQQNCMIS